MTSGSVPENRTPSVIEIVELKAVKAIAPEHEAQSRPRRLSNRQSGARRACHSRAGRAGLAGRAVMGDCADDEGWHMHSEARGERGMGIPAWPLSEKGAKQSQFWQDVTICRKKSSVQTGPSRREKRSHSSRFLHKRRPTALGFRQTSPARDFRAMIIPRRDARLSEKAYYICGVGATHRIILKLVGCTHPTKRFSDRL